jgi:hypothetical protein
MILKDPTKKIITDFKFYNVSQRITLDPFYFPNYCMSSSLACFAQQGTMQLIQRWNQYYNSFFEVAVEDISNPPYNSDKDILDLLSYMKKLYAHSGLHEGTNFKIAENRLHTIQALSQKQID